MTALPSQQPDSDIVAVQCLKNQSYRVELEECPYTHQLNITLMGLNDREGGPDHKAVCQLFTYDSDRASMVVEHIASQDDPDAFCRNLAAIYGVRDPNGVIALDTDPRPTARAQGSRS